MDDTTSRDPSSAANRPRTTLPLFPLDTVLLPGAHLPLHIFEPRYRQLVAELINSAEHDREFGIVTIRTALDHEVHDLDQVHPIGCSTLLREADRLPDGQYDIVTTGRRRFRLLHIDADAAEYLMGTVEWVDDDPVPESARHAASGMIELARDAHRRYCDFAWDGEWTEPSQDLDPGELAYALAADCLLHPIEQRSLLAETHPLRRLSMTRNAIARETSLLTTLRAVPAPASRLLHNHGPSSLN